MRRRRLRWVLAGLAVLLLVAGAFVLWPQPERFTRENCGRVEEGMTRAEVESLLGPPGDYRTGPSDYDAGLVPIRVAPITMPPWETSDNDACWAGDSAYMAVRFDSAGRAHAWYCVPTSKAAQSRLDDLVWRAKRQWRRWFPER
jgi:hypothetical protein